RSSTRLRSSPRCERRARALGSPSSAAGSVTAVAGLARNRRAVAACEALCGHRDREGADREQRGERALELAVRHLPHLPSGPGAARDERGAECACIRGSRAPRLVRKAARCAPALCRLRVAPERVDFAAQPIHLTRRAEPGSPWTWPGARFETQFRVNPV